jgi:hypothetical protein
MGAAGVLGGGIVSSPPIVVPPPLSGVVTTTTVSVVSPGLPADPPPPGSPAGSVLELEPPLLEPPEPPPPLLLSPLPLELVLPLGGVKPPLPSPVPAILTYRPPERLSRKMISFFDRLDRQACPKAQLIDGKGV